MLLRVFANIYIFLIWSWTYVNTHYFLTSFWYTLSKWQQLNLCSALISSLYYIISSFSFTLLPLMLKISVIVLNLLFIVFHTFSIEFKSGKFVGHGNFSTPFWPTYSLAIVARWTGTYIHMLIFISITLFWPEPVRNFWKKVPAVAFWFYLPRFSF